MATKWNDGSKEVEGRTNITSIRAIATTTAGVLLLLAFVVGAWHIDPALRAAPSAQDGPMEVRIVLPLAAPELDFDDLVQPPTVAATPVPTDTPAPTATPTPEPSPTPTEVLCHPQLADRVVVSEIDVSPASVQVVPRGTNPDFTTFPVMTELRADGNIWIGWADTTETIHLTPVDRQGVRLAEDWTVPGSEIRGLTPRNDGGVALLALRSPSLYLVRLDDQGELMWETELFGSRSQTATGSKFIVEWPRESRLRWNGTEYAAYVGHTQYFGSRGKHQGDLLWFFDDEGNRIEGDRGWDWGCSHSLDVRLAWNGTRWGPVCLSDSYPTKAFNLSHQEKVLRREPTGDTQGRSEARLGGWIPMRDGFMMTFASPTGRDSRDVGFMRVSNDATVGPITWLTDTDDVTEDGPHLAIYGRNFLAAWSVGENLVLTEVDPSGTTITEPSTSDTWLAPKDDMLSIPGGDVVWAGAWDDRTKLKLARLDYCRIP